MAVAGTVKNGMVLILNWITSAGFRFRVVRFKVVKQFSWNALWLLYMKWTHRAGPLGSVKLAMPPRLYSEPV